MIDVIWGSTDKPISSRRLAEVLANQSDWSGALYIGYPIIGTPDGSFPIDALLVEEKKGVFIFSLVEGKKLSDVANLQDEAFSKMQAKLLQHQTLVRKRQLLVQINTITFAPAIPKVDSDGEYLICNEQNLIETIDNCKDSEKSVYPALVAVLQAISNLRRGRKKRVANKSTSRGSKLKSLEDSIANLDSQQSAAVVETFDGVQRIRGLAGCGKTIVLALKVAYLHARHPDWLIAVTFNTRSLKKQFENLITTFVFEQANEEPDWDRIRIMNAWGAPGGLDRTGIYYEFCRDHGIEYMDFGSAKTQFGPKYAFERVCNLALQGVRNFHPKYDAILVDEAQDFSPNFLLLCYEYLKDPKRLVYAYDELQNLGDRSLPAAEEIFGKNPDGTPRVLIGTAVAGKPKQDIILDICYRNSRPVLSTAHALGFGIYRKKGLAQIFESKNLWFDIGYEERNGDIIDGEMVTLSRTPKSSPEILEKHSSPDDLIQFHRFDSRAEQANWLVRAIQSNVADDELLPEDIVVINPDPLTTREEVGAARRGLLELEINSNLAGVTTIADVFTVPGSVTFTGVFRAKGNEAAMVYVMNAQDCFDARLPRDVAKIRNRLFTAITRSKAWVRVLGVGESMDALIDEFEAVKKNDFDLRFKYPDAEERRSMMTVNRDMSQGELERANKRRVDFAEIIDSLESGESFLEDYPSDLIEKLMKLISNGKKGGA